MGESQNGCFKKTKHVKFSKNRTFLLPDTHRYMFVSWSKKCSFFGKFDLLCFLVTPVSRFALFLFAYDLQSVFNNLKVKTDFWKASNSRFKKVTIRNILVCRGRQVLLLMMSFFNIYSFTIT